MPHPISLSLVPSCLCSLFEDSVLPIRERLGRIVSHDSELMHKLGSRSLSRKTISGGGREPAGRAGELPNEANYLTREPDIPIRTASVNDLYYLCNGCFFAGKRDAKILHRAVKQQSRYPKDEHYRVRWGRQDHGSLLEIEKSSHRRRKEHMHGDGGPPKDSLKSIFSRLSKNVRGRRRRKSYEWVAERFNNTRHVCIYIYQDLAVPTTP